MEIKKKFFFLVKIRDEKRRELKKAFQFIIYFIHKNALTSIKVKQN